MRCLLVAIVVAIVCLTLAACGGGNSTSTATTSPTDTVANGQPPHTTVPSHQRAHPKTGKAPIRKTAELCFKPGALTVDAGESFSGIESGQSFPGRERIIKTAIHSAVLPTVRAELQAAKRHVDSATASQVHRVEAAAKQGMNQLTHNPDLLVRGHVPGFDRAQALIERYNLSRC